MSPRSLHPSVLKTSQRLSLPQCLHRPRGPSSCSAPRALESESRLAVGTPGTTHVINRPYCGKVPAVAFEPQGGVLVPQLFASLVQGSSGQHSPTPPPKCACLGHLSEATPSHMLSSPPLVGISFLPLRLQPHSPLPGLRRWCCLSPRVTSATVPDLSLLS